MHVSQRPLPTPEIPPAPAVGLPPEAINWGPPDPNTRIDAPAQAAEAAGVREKISGALERTGAAIGRFLGRRGFVSLKSEAQTYVHNEVPAGVDPTAPSVSELVREGTPDSPRNWRAELAGLDPATISTSFVGDKTKESGRPRHDWTQLDNLQPFIPKTRTETSRDLRRIYANTDLGRATKIMEDEKDRLRRSGRQYEVQAERAVPPTVLQAGEQGISSDGVLQKMDLGALTGLQGVRQIRRPRG